jgi:nicotinate phosphoribosyltransferase
LSENVEKITTPAFKTLWRLYDIKTNSPIADVVMLKGEVIDDSKPYELFHPEFTWKRKTLKDFYAKELLIQIFDKGRLIYELPSIEEVRNHSLTQVNNLWDEVKRFENPHRYFVDLSPKLWTLKREMIQRVKEQLSELTETDN